MTNILSRRPRSTVTRSAATLFLTALLYAVLLAPAADAALVPDGPRIDVDGLGAGYTAVELQGLAEQTPRVVMDAEGGFIVFWHQADADPLRPEVVARRFAADGTPLWATRPYWDPVSGNGPVGGLDALAGNAAGDFVIGWLNEDGSVAVRAFDVCGDPLGDVVQVGAAVPPVGETILGVESLHVGITEERELVVAFVRRLQASDDSTFEQIVAQRYDAAGQALEQGRLVAGGTDVTNISLSVGGDGSFIVAYERLRANGERLLNAQGYDAAGQRRVVLPAAEFSAEEFQPSLAVDGEGRVLMAFESPQLEEVCDRVFARIDRGDGTPRRRASVAPGTRGCQEAPVSAGLDSGWIVVWRGSDNAFPAERGVHLSYLPAAGSLGEEEVAVLRVLPAFAGEVAVASRGSRAVVAAVLPSRTGGEPRLAVQRLAPPGEVACGAGGGDQLCLQDGRFRADVEWRDPYAVTAVSGLGRARTLGGVEDSGAFWYFRPDNLELMVKVLDGTAINGHHWVFYGSLSTVESWVAVTDLATGAQKVYYNPPFEQVSFADNAAFPVAGAAGEEARSLATGSAGWPAALSPDALPAPEELVVAGQRSGFLAIPATDLGAPGVARAPLSPVGCGASEEALCLGRDFQVTVEWKNPRNGEAGVGRAIPLTGDTGAFWFFRPDNVELMVKVLDGRAINGYHWVFYAGLSDVEYTVTVTPPVGGGPVTFTNPAFHLGGESDTSALPDHGDF